MPPGKQLDIRSDADVLEAFRATGHGWQTRINKVLRDWIKEKEPEKSRRAHKSGLSVKVVIRS
jgi:hypothetical protein